ncbi:hypothetical protein M3599_24190, partial [Niallia circulans]|uniref:hypothetical protein n=1 Tax=Niallia circulans TaxID=1397 RepID=UPI0020426037
PSNRHLRFSILENYFFESSRIKRILLQRLESKEKQVGQGSDRNEHRSVRKYVRSRVKKLTKRYAAYLWSKLS